MSTAHIQTQTATLPLDLKIYMSELKIFVPKPKTLMVRPKASRENITIAVVFADIVTFHSRQETPDEWSNAIVGCKGRFSIFAVFSKCFPELVRDSHEKAPRNRHGVTLVEMNKALVMAGLQAKRIRDRKGGAEYRHFQV